MMISANLTTLCRAALRAGAAIRIIAESGVVAQEKADGTPVCAADHIGEEIIVDALREAWPEACIVGEESVSQGHAVDLQPRVILVDALDGTREFMAGRDEYTVNIGIVENGIPVMGVVYQPATGALYAGECGVGAIRVEAGDLDPDDVRSLAARAVPLTGANRPEDRKDWRAVISRSHPDSDTLALLEQNGISIRVAAGSSLKFCLLAAGEADIYPRLGPINAWDIAAAHAVLLAADGAMTQPDGTPYRYNFGMYGFSCPPFVAWASAPEALAVSSSG